MTAALQERMPPARYRDATVAHAFTPGDLVTFNGYTGKVSSYSVAGLVVVTFGRGRRRELSESALQVFVPWWSDRD